MRANDMILRLLDEQGVSQRALSRSIGSSSQTVSNQLRKARSMKVGVFASMLDALGYELVAVPKGNKHAGRRVEV